jgi:hypothetical protein
MQVQPLRRRQVLPVATLINHPPSPVQPQVQRQPPLVAVLWMPVQPLRRQQVLQVAMLDNHPPPPVQPQGQRQPPLVAGMLDCVGVAIWFCSILLFI